MEDITTATPKKPGKSRLGRGLGALIPATTLEVVEGTDRVRSADDGKVVGVVADIEIAKIVANKMQPRQRFDREAMEELKNSIREKGVISPITVRRSNKAGLDGYEIIAGERRFRASSALGRKTIPAYILDVDTDAEMLELALIENVQRQDLDPIEVALGYQQLIEECKLTQEEVSKKVGKDRSTVTNALRLLRLPEETQELLRERKLSVGHVRSLLSLSDDSAINAIAKRISEQEGSVSVRDTEKIVRLIQKEEKSIDEALLFLGKEKEQQVETIDFDAVEGESESVPSPVPAPAPLPPPPGFAVEELNKAAGILEQNFQESPQAAGVAEQPKKPALPPEPSKSPEIIDLEEKLQQHFSTRVKLKVRTDNSGTIEIDFSDEEQLDRLTDVLLQQNSESGE